MIRRYRAKKLWQHRYTDIEKKVLRSLNDFFYNEAKGDYDLARKNVKQCGITGIVVEDGYVMLLTTRPGIVIGAKGSRIDALSLHIRQNIGGGYKVEIYESQNPEAWIIPEDFSNFEGGIL